MTESRKIKINVIYTILIFEFVQNPKTGQVILPKHAHCRFVSIHVHVSIIDPPIGKIEDNFFSLKADLLEYLLFLVSSYFYRSLFSFQKFYYPHKGLFFLGVST